MDCSISSLRPAFERTRAAGTPLVLATLVATRGSTYRKAGAQIAIAPDGACSGLLSGGCLESDLAGHAREVFATGAAQALHYVSTGDETDALWGLGSGCEGEMDIWLTRHAPEQDWYPLPALLQAVTDGTPATWGLVLRSAQASLPVGCFVVESAREGCVTHGRIEAALQVAVQESLRDPTVRSQSEIRTLPGFDDVELFATSIVLPRRLLVLGAGPDAIPVVQFAAALGWHVHVHDHRPAYAVPANFPGAAAVTQGTVAELPSHVELDRFDAAVVMSHHLPSDLGYLQALASSAIPYVGLLGPASRREHLLRDLGAGHGARLGARLHAPIGLDLGGRDPASIALAIVAQVQAQFHGRGARRIG